MNARGQVEVAPLAGDPVQLDERHLDLGMAVDGQSRPDGPTPGRRESAARVATSSSRSSPSAAVPGDRRLDQVADAVELVAPAQVAVLVSPREDLDEAVDVAVGPLGRRRPASIAWSAIAASSGVALPGRAPSRRPRATCRRPSRGTGTAVSNMMPRACTDPGPRPRVEVVEVAGALELVEAVRDRSLPIDPQASRPRTRL